MKTNLASLEIACVLKELQFMVGGKIDKIFQPKKSELILQLHVPNHGKKYLRVLAGSLMYLTNTKESSDKPPGFCMFLRKHLANSRIRAINQLGFERIVEIQLETKDSAYSLIFELFGTGNILLLKDKIILSAIEYKKWKDRLVTAKQEYISPELSYNLMTLTETELIGLLDKTTRESVVKSLAIDLGLGGIYAEELCLIAKINKNAVPRQFKKISELFQALLELRKLNIKPYIIDGGRDIVPLDLLYYRDANKIEQETFNQALDSFFSEAKVKEDKTKTTQNKEIAKLERMIDSQNKNIKKLEKDEELNRSKADQIYANYQLISEILAELKKAMTKHSFDDIKKKLKGHKIIKEVDTKNKTIVVEFKDD